MKNWGLSGLYSGFLPGYLQAVRVVLLWNIIKKEKKEKEFNNSIRLFNINSILLTQAFYQIL